MTQPSPLNFLELRSIYSYKPLVINDAKLEEPPKWIISADSQANDIISKLKFGISWFKVPDHDHIFAVPLLNT